MVGNEMRTLIHDEAAEHVLEQEARKHTDSMRADGRRNVLNGVTTLEEVLRVTREE
ncbi:MAG: hypothetical protein RLO11_09535 [Salinisphaeraceae bacterium]